MQLEQKVQDLSVQTRILNEVFDYCDENASAVSIPEFKASLTH